MCFSGSQKKMTRLISIGGRKGLRACFGVFARTFAVLVVGVLCGMDANAVCFKYSDAAFRSVTIDMGVVQVPANLPVGGTIGTKTFSVPGTGSADIILTCDGATPGNAGVGAVLRTPVSGFSKVYSTGVTGVGIRMTWDGATGATYPFTFPFTGLGTVYVNVGTFMTVELIKTAAVTGNGPLAGGTYTTFSGNGDNVPVVTSMMSPNTKILSPSCIVDAGSKNISVQFGNVALNSFSGAGSTSPSRAFDIKLQCNAGLDAQNTVYLKMEATPDASNQPGVLRISQSGAGVAGGVGIQVLDAGNNGVKFGEEVKVGASKDGVYTLPYTARYYQTGPKVTAGRADGTATFTLSYK